MAETKTAAPRRRATGAAAKPAAASKRTPAKAAAPAPVAEEAPQTVNKFMVELVPAGETKSYAVFTFPEGTGCVGKVYVPHGTKAVKVLIKGDLDESSEDE